MLVNSQSETQTQLNSSVATIAPPAPKPLTAPPKTPDTLPRRYFPPKPEPDQPVPPEKPIFPTPIPDPPDFTDPVWDQEEIEQHQLKKEVALAHKAKRANPEDIVEPNLSEKTEKQATEQPFSGAQGTGRRKSAIARVQLHFGTGHIVVNKKRFRQYLQGNRFLIEKVLAPLKLVRFPLKDKSLDISVFVYGGGLMGQADAIQLGISRALCNYDKDYRRPFKAKGFLTRDARVKERKKYGLKKARKAPQYSKR
jgi:small subunit ribosomal protein S9